MTNMELDLNKRVQGLRAILERPAMRQQISFALPRHMTPEKMVRVAMTAISKTPALAECSQLSIIASIVELAQYGLEPDGRLAHLIPRYNSKTRNKECTPLIDYRGWIALAHRSPKVTKIYSQIVYEKDVFSVELGSVHRLIHKPAIHLTKEQRGAKVGAYAICFFKEGDPDFELMTAEEIEEVKDRFAPERDGKVVGPWESDPDEMWKKTPIRRLAKRLPVSAEDTSLIKAATSEEYREKGIDPPTFDMPTIEIPAEPVNEKAQDPSEGLVVELLKILGADDARAQAIRMEFDGRPSADLVRHLQKLVSEMPSKEPQAPAPSNAGGQGKAQQKSSKGDSQKPAEAASEAPKREYEAFVTPEQRAELVGFCESKDIARGRFLQLLGNHGFTHEKEIPASKYSVILAELKGMVAP